MANFAHYFKVCKEDNSAVAPAQTTEEKPVEQAVEPVAATTDDGANSTTENTTPDQTITQNVTSTDTGSEVATGEGTELVQTANETEKLEEAKEQAETVVKDVESDIEAQEEIIEKSPEAVTSQDAVIATETFKANAFKLDVKIEDLGMSINKESITSNPLEAVKTNVSNMKKFVSIAKESISTMEADIKANREYMWDMCNLYITHKEYNAFDWPKFFLGSTIVGLWRKIVKGGKTTVANPGIMVDLFLGKWTSFGDYVSGMQINGINVIGSLISASSSKSAMSLRGLTEQIKDSENAYYRLVTNQDTKLTIEQAKKLVSDFDKIVATLKKNVCKPISARNLTFGELNDLKLFRPDLIKPEIDKAAQNMIKKSGGDAKSEKEWKNIYNHLSQSALGVVKYLTDHLNGYEYTEGETV